VIPSRRKKARRIASMLPNPAADATCLSPPSARDERDSNMGGGAVYHDNRVRVDKA
jgi:hypothetical protein